MKKMYVGNLSWNVTDESLNDFFAQYGEVSSARVITDRETGRSRGFGFVEIDDEGFGKAIEAADGVELDGRAIRVNQAQERERRPQNRW